MPLLIGAVTTFISIYKYNLYQRKQEHINPVENESIKASNNEYILSYTNNIRNRFESKKFPSHSILMNLW